MHCKEFFVCSKIFAALLNLTVAGSPALQVALAEKKGRGCVIAFLLIAISLPVHVVKRQPMVPGGQFMTENDPASLYRAMPDRQIILQASDA
jgi:hypothetical protein